MAAQNMRELVESTQAKAIQFLVMVIMVPMMFWWGNRIISDLDTLKTNQQAAAIRAAEITLRVDALERSGLSRQEAIDRVKEQTTRLEYEIKLFKETTRR